MPEIAAIFDLDRTLLTRSSGTLFVKYMRQSGQLWNYFGRREVARTVADMLRYQVGLMDAVEAMRRLARLADGIDLDEMWSLVNRWFDDYLIHEISIPAREQVQWHRDRGHIPVICSAANQFAVITVASHLQIDQYAYSEWLVEDGKLTGTIGEPIVYGKEKLRWMQTWSAEHNVDLGCSYFYSDDASDLPLLNVVEYPVAVNPHRSLKKIANKRDWPILNWR